MLFDCLCNLLSAVQRKWVLGEPYRLSMNGMYNLLLCGPNVYLDYAYLCVLIVI